MQVPLSTYADITSHIFGLVKRSNVTQQPRLHTPRKKFKRHNAISTSSRSRVQAKASPSSQDFTEPAKVLIEVSPFLTLWVIPAVSGVFAGYIGASVADLADLGEPLPVANGVLFAICTVLFNIFSALWQERRNYRKRSITIILQDAKSITVTIGSVMDSCGNDLAKFTAALKKRLAVDESRKVTVKAKVKSGAEIDVQDQILADGSLSDFLREVEEVTVIQT